MDADAVERIGQTHKGPSRWLPSQAAAYLRVHTGLTSGEFAQVILPTAGAPGLDGDRAGNQKTLLALHPAFLASVDVTQDHADADGLLSWERPITADQSTGVGLPESVGTRPAARPVRIPAGAVPLEIGYTLPSRTLHHLLQDGGVARWPYHHQNVCVLLNLRPGSSDARMAAIPRERVG